MRKLAEKSKVAADEIVALAESGVNISQKAGTDLQELVPEIERTTKLIQEISAASHEQNQGADQVNQAIQLLNQVTQQNAAEAEELATNSEELASQADQLKELVSFFKVDHNDKHAEHISTAVIPKAQTHTKNTKEPTIKEHYTEKTPEHAGQADEQY